MVTEFVGAAINCLSSVPTHWEFNGKALNFDILQFSQKYRLTSNGIVIIHTNQDDNGIYTCHGSSLNGSSYVLNSTLRVTGKKIATYSRIINNFTVLLLISHVYENITGYNENLMYPLIHEVPKGLTTLITCLIQPPISWRFNGGPLLNGVEFLRTSVILLIKRTLLAHGGTYTCRSPTKWKIGDKSSLSVVGKSYSTILGLNIPKIISL